MHIGPPPPLYQPLPIFGGKIEPIGFGGTPSDGGSPKIKPVTQLGSKIDLLG